MGAKHRYDTLEELTLGDGGVSYFVVQIIIVQWFNFILWFQLILTDPCSEVMFSCYDNCHEGHIFLVLPYRTHDCISRVCYVYELSEHPASTFTTHLRNHMSEHLGIEIILHEEAALAQIDEPRESFAVVEAAAKAVLEGTDEKYMR